MRETTYLTLTSPLVTDRLRPWLNRGHVGRHAFAYLRGRVKRRELVSRSVVLYHTILDEFTQFSHGYTMSEAFADTSVTEFLWTLRHDRFKQQLARQVLRHFATARAQRKPRSLCVPLQTIECDERPLLEPVATGRSGLENSPPVRGTRVPSYEEFMKIEDEVEHILRMTAAERGMHTADHYMIMRAAAVAFCRFGGAVVADLCTLRLADVQTDPEHHEDAFIGHYWLARRPRRGPGRTGPDRFVTLQILYEARARAPIAAWVKIRRRDVAAPTDFVFIDPATEKPLSRQQVWRLVAGHALKEARRRDVPIHTPRRDRPPVKDANSPPFLSPAKLRHAQGIGLAQTFPPGETRNAAFRNHLGVSRRGLATTYQDILQEPER